MGAGEGVGGGGGWRAGGVWEGVASGCLCTRGLRLQSEKRAVRMVFVALGREWVSGFEGQWKLPSRNGALVHDMFEDAPGG